LSSDQFAQSIKAKYPQYASVDNFTLAQKMVAKYPQYADRVQLGTPINAPAPDQMTPPEQPGIVQGMVRSVASPFMRLTANAVNAVEGKSGAKATPVSFGSYLGNATPVGQQGTFGQKLKDAIGTGAEIASNIPAVGGTAAAGRATLGGFLKTAAKTGAKAGAATGALSAGGQALEANKSLGETAKESALGGAAGAALGAANPALAGASMKAPKVAAKAAGATATKSASIIAGIPADTIQRASSAEHAPLIADNIRHIAEHPKQEYLALAQRTAHSINEAHTNALNDVIFHGKSFGQSFAGKDHPIAAITSPEYASKVADTIKEVASNPKAPFHELATRTAGAINGAEQDASQKLMDAASAFRKANPGATFNVRPLGSAMAEALSKFRSSGLVLDTQKDAAGRIRGFKLATTPQSPFTKHEMAALNELMGKIKASNKVGIDDLMALRKSFSTAYDAIPEGESGPTVYHAAVMSMKEPAEKIIDRILPAELKDANANYRAVQEMKDTFGNRITDGKGTVKPTAESFLSGLGNANKGELRNSVANLHKMVGIHLPSEVQAVNDAVNLSPSLLAHKNPTDAVRRALVQHYFTGPGAAEALVLRINQ
jgi:hypothetical protein